MDIKKRGAEVTRILKQHYPDSCSLDAVKPYELLFSVRLAAQCTDARVNIVTKDLYAKYPTLQSLADAPLEDLQLMVKPCGLGQTKGRDIKLASQMLIEQYGGVVPDTLEELLKLPGIGRKTANLILSDVYGKPAIVADTHCIRISGRLGLAPDCGKDPYKVEMALSAIIKPSEQSSLCHRFVHFGRDICTARSPKCHACPLTGLCEDYKNRTEGA